MPAELRRCAWERDKEDHPAEKKRRQPRSAGSDTARCCLIVVWMAERHRNRDRQEVQTARITGWPVPVPSITARPPGCATANSPSHSVGVSSRMTTQQPRRPGRRPRGRRTEVRSERAANPDLRSVAGPAVSKQMRGPADSGPQPVVKQGAKRLRQANCKPQARSADRYLGKAKGKVICFERGSRSAFRATCG